MGSLAVPDKRLSPFLHYLKKMELELTCPSCCVLYRQPTILPCSHIICSQCITTKNGYQYECPVCITTFLRRDAKHFMLMESITEKFRNLDKAKLSFVAKLGTQDYNNSDGNLQASQVGTNLPSMESPLQSGMRTIPTGGGKVDAENATKDARVSQWEPSTPPSLGKSPGTDQQINCQASSLQLIAGTQGSPTENLEAEIYANKSDTEHGRRDSISNHAYIEESEKCAFCHLSTISQYTGQMLHYVNEKPASPEEVDQPNVKHFHERCFEWAPQAFFEGEIARNLEGELERALKLKCSICGKKGAAVGCLIESCEKVYHVPCTVDLQGCRWDHNKFHMLCPFHSLCKFTSETSEVVWKNKAKRSSQLHDTSKALRRRKVVHSSVQIRKECSLPGQLAPVLEEQSAELRMIETDACSKLVLCGSDLPKPDMERLNKFASSSGATVSGQWKENVTHVIVSTDKHGACKRTHKVLMAILKGKWVVTINWLVASMIEKYPVSEEPYEIRLDQDGASNGPKKGRIRAMRKEPRIFSGLSFYLDAAQFDPHIRLNFEELVVVAGGVILKESELTPSGLNKKVSSSKSSYIVYNEDVPEDILQTCNWEEFHKIGKKRCELIGLLAKRTGFMVIGHISLLDTIASCNSANDLEERAYR